MLNHKSPLHFLLLPIAILLFGMVLSSCDTAPKGKVEVVSAAVIAKQLSTPNLQLVDVRTAAEFAQGTIKGSKKAAAQLLEMGFTTIYDFSGGYSTWSSQHNNQ